MCFGFTSVGVCFWFGFWVWVFPALGGLDFGNSDNLTLVVCCRVGIIQLFVAFWWLCWGLVCFEFVNLWASGLCVTNLLGT